MKIDLLQPKDLYADEGRIYTNTSLWTIGSILDDVGVDINLHDENLREAKSLYSNIVGINLLGAPYIPVAIETMQKLKNKFGNDLTFILGGQILTQKRSKTGDLLGLDDSQFQKIFGDKVYNGMKPGVLESLLDIKNISDGHTISLIPMYQKLSDEDFKEYFVREASFYISQGCKFDCGFCAAANNKKEQYRDEDVMYEDLSYIVKRLQKLGKNQVTLYMLNLDVFQSPKQLEGFADMVLQIKKNNPDFVFSLRGLAGTNSFINLDVHYPIVLEKLVKAGFDNVGYGIDGMGAEIWKGIKKPQNNEKDSLDAIRLSREKYNITPELLMVFGHVGIDDEKSLKNAYEFVEAMVAKYGALPRPHIAKHFLPGNNGRISPDFRDQVNFLIENPRFFQSLDFTALANTITHPDADFRKLVNEHYLKMCALPGNTTEIIIPYEIGDSDEEIEYKKRKNMGKYDCGGKEIISIIGNKERIDASLGNSGVK